MKSIVLTYVIINWQVSRKTDISFQISRFQRLRNLWKPNEHISDVFLKSIDTCIAENLDCQPKFISDNEQLLHSSKKNQRETRLKIPTNTLKWYKTNNICKCFMNSLKFLLYSFLTCIPTNCYSISSKSNQLAF